MNAKNIRQELKKFSPTLLSDFDLASKRFKAVKSHTKNSRWANLGLSFARDNPSDLDVVSDYFQVIPEIAAFLKPKDFTLWENFAITLIDDSPIIAKNYFRSSAKTLSHIHSDELEKWVSIGRFLLNGSPQSVNLASIYFEKSPDILNILKIGQLDRFVRYVELSSRKSAEIASESLRLAEEMFPAKENGKEALLQLIAIIIRGNSKEMLECFRSIARTTGSVDEETSFRIFSLAHKMSTLAEDEVSIIFGNAPLSSFLESIGTVLAELDKKEQSLILLLCDNLLAIAPRTIPSFVRNCNAILGRIGVDQLQIWFDEGIQILQDNRTAGYAYFQLESKHSEEFIDRISSSVELGSIKELMRLYSHAIAGVSIDIAPTENLISKGIGWVSAEKPSTDGSTVFLPTISNSYPNKESNFAWYKVIATHQTAHLEFGSFLFKYDKPGNIFTTSRPTEESEASVQSSNPRAWLTDMQRFFSLFSDRQLSLDVFTILEDSRLDHLVVNEYLGIRSNYLNVQKTTLSERNQIVNLKAREAIMEFLLRVGLDKQSIIQVPKLFLLEAKKIRQIATRMLSTEALVEDSAEATLRIYSIISEIPNIEISPDDWTSVDLSDKEDEEYSEEPLDSEGEGDTSDAQDKPGENPENASDKSDNENTEEEPEQHPYNSPQDISYRGDFKPELVQLLAELRKMQKESGEHNQPDEPTVNMIQELLKENPELSGEGEEGELNPTINPASSLLREAGFSPPPGQYYGQTIPPHVDEEGSPLTPTEPFTYTYDEWDYRASDYKPRWCMVHEKKLEEGESNFYEDTLKNNSILVSQIRHHFEMALPEVFRKIKRLNHGEEFDLDAAIESFVDRRIGVTPSDKVYWRRNKVERDVAVAFLLDMSASTAEAIEESKSPKDGWDPPKDPAEYMIWLRSLRSELFKRSYQRIIDLEKESIVLLIQAMETLGDKYGIYGFSGYGRENVEFYTVKDITENFSNDVKMRVANISPLHATRMGPAIRHATSKLMEIEAKTKLLFLISDGRPQDRGYSREGVEKEYAIHDTKMALNEARNKKIVPFCLTVDKAGHDYLKTMCSDMGYEVLADISSLPKRIPYLYHKLTI